MKPCFADTFFFLALLNGGDRYHAQAIDLNRIDRPIITTSFVLLELADHLCDAHNRHLTTHVQQALASDRRFTILPANQLLFDRALALYSARTDKSWSLTDCTSFITMQDNMLMEALTGDRHFEQAGFTALFR